MNKKAGKIISVYWFAILFIVTAAIVYMAFIFYGQPYDVREVEANVLIDKIADCISEGGKLNENYYDLNKGNLLEICHLNFDVEDSYNWKTQGQYYVEINVSDFDINNGIDLDSERLKSSAGNSDLKDNCWKNEKTFPFCVEKSFYVLGNEKFGDNNQSVIKILSIIRKTEKNG